MARTKEAARKYVGKKVNLNNDKTSTAKRASVPPRPEQTEYDETIAPKDPSLLSDTFSQAIKRHYGDSTSIEQGDLYLAPQSFQDTTAFGNPRLGRELPEFIKSFHRPGDDDPSTCKEAGAPHTIVIASSGIRVAGLVRDLRVFNSNQSKIGKYFAKHMKLQPNLTFAKQTKVGIAVGTPVRLKELIANDGIKAGSLQRIIIDGSYQNEKKYTIFDMADSFRSMLDLLNMEGVKSRLLDDNDKLLIMVF